MAFSTTPPRNDYVGNGAVVTYTFGFRIFAATDLKVTVQDLVGVETALVYPTDFSVPATSINNPDGGTITLINASILSGGFFISGYGLTIRFFETTNQPTDLRNQGGFFLEVIEDLFDRVVRFIQQGEDKINRSLHIPETETPSEAKTLLPTVTNRASKFLAFDASGNPIATAGAVSSIAISTFMQTVVDDTSAAAALTTLLAEELSPAQITANQNDYNPASLSTVNVLRINTDASRNITGLSGGVDGRLLFVWNVGSFDAVLVNESSSSTAANRFAFPADMRLNPNDGILLRYDSTSSRWRPVGDLIPGDGTWGQTLAPNSSLLRKWTGPVTDNPIINPAMEIWQRGTSFAAATHGLYTADRWVWSTVGAGVVTVSRQTNVPTVAQAGVLFNYSLDVDVTTADASIAAGDGYGVYQVIEGYNWRHFAQRAFTVSFWVRDTITGEHAVSFRNAAVDRSYIATYTVDVADTWEYKTVTVSASPSAGTWDYINGIGLYVFFTLAVGSTFQTTAGAWQTGNFLGTATTVNSMSSTSNFFRVTGVKLELGSVATPLQFRSFQDELALCQRYYAKTFAYATVPVQASASTVGAVFHFAPAVIAPTIQWFYPVRMRTTPTITTYNPVSANADWRDVTAGTDKTVSVNPDSNIGDTNVSISAGANAAAGDHSFIHAVANAEL